MWKLQNVKDSECELTYIVILLYQRLSGWDWSSTIHPHVGVGFLHKVLNNVQHLRNKQQEHYNLNIFLNPHSHVLFDFTCRWPRSSNILLSYVIPSQCLDLDNIGLPDSVISECELVLQPSVLLNPSLQPSDYRRICEVQHIRLLMVLFINDSRKF